MEICTQRQPPQSFVKQNIEGHLESLESSGLGDRGGCLRSIGSLGNFQRTGHRPKRNPNRLLVIGDAQ